MKDKTVETKFDSGSVCFFFRVLSSASQFMLSAHVQVNWISGLSLCCFFK